MRAQKTILPRTVVKWLIMTGSALAVIGQVLLTGLSPHGNYAGEIVPSLILTGLGVGCLFCSAIFGARSASGQVTPGSPARWSIPACKSAGPSARQSSVSFS